MCHHEPVTNVEPEHPQPVDRRALFRAYMRHLDPKADPSLALRSGFYVHSPYATSAQIATRLDIDPASTHLIIGAVGSGKTTELLTVADTLATSTDIIPLFVDVPSVQLVSKLTEGVLVGLAWTQIWKHIEENRSALADKHREEARYATSAAAGFDTNDPGEGDDPDGDFFHVPGLISAPENNSRLDRILQTLARILDGSGLRYVVLFDGLDRTRKTDALVTMLPNDLFLLARVGVGSVVVGPPELRGEVYRQFAERFATFHFHGAADVTSEAGIAFLSSVLRLRALDDILPEDARLQIARWSGGILRDLIALARNSGEVAYSIGADRITPEHVDIAADRFGRALLLGLSHEATKRLMELSTKPLRLPRTKSFVEFTVSSDVDIDLLVRRLVIEFPDLPPRFALHPTIRPLLRGLGGLG